MSTLVLLVGTNPLPNYIVAKYLYTCGKPDLKPEQILLVCTAHTYDIAKRLKMVFEDELHASVEEPLSFDDPFDNKDREYLIKKLTQLQKLGPIHLNYTGGTKAMGIQVYQLVKILEEQARKQNKTNSFSYSYLDASSNLLKFDDGMVEPRTKTGVPFDMRRASGAKVTLNTLLDLHDCKKIKPKSVGAYPEIAIWLFDKLASKVPDIAEEPSFRTFQVWINRCKELNKGKVSEEQKKQFLDEYVWPDGRDFEELANLLAHYYNHNPQDCTWGNLFNREWSNSAKEKRDTLIDFLHGPWLEILLHEKLSSHLNDEAYFDLPLTECHRNIRAKRGDAKEGMELDVVLMRGYELTIVSCTVAGYGLNKDQDRSVLKNKAFEVLHRARQLGGEQAQAVLVTLAETAIIQSLMEDLKTDFGHDGTFNLTILGRQALVDLLKKTADGKLLFNNPDFK